MLSQIFFSFSIDLSVQDNISIFNENQVDGVNSLSKELYKKSGIYCNFLSDRDEILKIRGVIASKGELVRVLFSSAKKVDIEISDDLNTLFTPLFIKTVVSGTERIFRDKGADEALTFVFLNLAERVAQNRDIPLSSLLEKNGGDVNSEKVENNKRGVVSLWILLLPILIPIPFLINRKKVVKYKRSSSFGGDLLSHQSTISFGVEDSFNEKK
jgi:hypothetical protein